MAIDDTTAHPASTQSPPWVPGPGDPVAIEVRGLEKSFRIPTHRVDSLKERIVHPFSTRDYRDLRALDGISFEIRKGEFFGIGFNMELTARENVVLNGVMMGLSPAETRTRLGAVIEFAELEEFADLKLKNFSSGMLVRLAFSVMMQADADVLLIDEV